MSRRAIIDRCGITYTCVNTWSESVNVMKSVNVMNLVPAYKGPANLNRGNMYIMRRK